MIALWPQAACVVAVPKLEERDAIRTACCILCCMSATRTQVYLSEDQRRRIDAVVEAEGVTLAEVVRRALDLYLAEVHPDAGPALAATFGADPDAEYPDRDQWDRA